MAVCVWHLFLFSIFFYKNTFQASNLLSTSAPKSDIDSAAKFIGAGENNCPGTRYPITIVHLTFLRCCDCGCCWIRRWNWFRFWIPHHRLCQVRMQKPSYKIWWLLKCLKSQLHPSKLMSRNPSLKQQLFSYAILGFALSEAMGLFCLMMAFLLLFAF